MNPEELEEYIRDPELWKAALDMACSEGALGPFSGEVSPFKIRDLMWDYFRSLQAKA